MMGGVLCFGTDAEDFIKVGPALTKTIDWALNGPDFEAVTVTRENWIWIVWYAAHEIATSAAKDCNQTTQIQLGRLS